MKEKLLLTNSHCVTDGVVINVRAFGGQLRARVDYACTSHTHSHHNVHPDRAAPPDQQVKKPGNSALFKAEVLGRNDASDLALLRVPDEAFWEGVEVRAGSFVLCVLAGGWVGLRCGVLHVWFSNLSV